MPGITLNWLRYAGLILIIYLVFSLLALNIFAGVLALASLVILFHYYRKNWLLPFFLILVILQNSFIAYNASLISNKEVFDMLHGINFFIIVFIPFFLFLISGTIDRKTYKLLILSFFILLLLIVYMIFGWIIYGFTVSLIYFRLFAVPVLMFWVGWHFANYSGRNKLRAVIKILLWVAFLGSVLQFLFPEIFIKIFQDVSYYGLKRGTSNIEEVIAYLRTNNFFNLSFTNKFMRAGGFVKSFISGAYFILLAALYIYWKDKKWIFFLILLLLSISLASKGVVLSFFFFLFYSVFYNKTKFHFSSLVFFQLVIIGFLIWLGFEHNNEHLLGFVNGAKYLLTEGNGLGFGGNLSPNRYLNWHLEELPDLGYYTRFLNGSESVWGVLFSSLGFSAILYLIALFIICYNSAGLIISKGGYILGFLILIMFFQGIFQEEAYSPYAFGFIQLLAGFEYRILKNN